VVRATFDALARQEPPRAVAQRRGKKPAELNARRRDGVGEAEVAEAVAAAGGEVAV